MMLSIISCDHSVRLMFKKLVYLPSYQVVVLHRVWIQSFIRYVFLQIFSPSLLLVLPFSEQSHLQNISFYKVKKKIFMDFALGVYPRHFFPSQRWQRFSMFSSKNFFITLHLYLWSILAILHTVQDRGWQKFFSLQNDVQHHLFLFTIFW